MKNRIDVDSLNTIGDLLIALSSINQSINDIAIQLFLGSRRDEEWKERANLALRKCKKVRRAICDKLAILRQREKETVEANRHHHNEYLIDEMKRYFPKAAFLACVHRAKLKAGGDRVNLDCVPISAYCREAGESIDAINKRLQREVWLEGVHVLKVDGSKERWVDLIEVAKWARKNKDRHHSHEG